MKLVVDVLVLLSDGKPRHVPVIDAVDLVAIVLEKVLRVLENAQAIDHGLERVAPHIGT